MRFQTIQLPASIYPDQTVFRHYVTLDDGTVHFQEEFLERGARTEWQQVNTPIAEPPVVGIIDFGGMPMAMRANGQAYLWGQIEVNLPDKGKVMVDTWSPFMDKVPV